MSEHRNETEFNFATMTVYSVDMINLHVAHNSITEIHFILELHRPFILMCVLYIQVHDITIFVKYLLLITVICQCKRFKTSLKCLSYKPLVKV